MKGVSILLTVLAGILAIKLMVRTIFGGVAKNREKKPPGRDGPGAVEAP